MHPRHWNGEGEKRMRVRKEEKERVKSAYGQLAARTGVLELGNGGGGSWLHLSQDNAMPTTGYPVLADPTRAWMDGSGDRLPQDRWACKRPDSQ